MARPSAAPEGGSQSPIAAAPADLEISEIVDVPNWVVSMTVPRGIFEA